MIKADAYFKENLTEILNYGNIDANPRPKYTEGKDAHSLFVTQVFEKYDISRGEFPITTLRNTAIKGGISEIIWIYSRQSNDLDVLSGLGCNWWDSWNIGDAENRHIGERYGKTVENWGLVDSLINGLRNDPFGRRHIMNLWQENDLRKEGGLHPCAYETMWSCRFRGKKMYLDMHLNQRSSDFCTAGSINKIQYVALMMMIAHELGYEVGVFSHYVQNLHIYDRHIDAANEILETKPLNIQPKIELFAQGKSFYEIETSDFKITGISEIKKIKSPLELAV